MISLILRNLFFICIQPGIVTVLLPYLLLYLEKIDFQFKIQDLQDILGSIVLVSGVIIVAVCVWSFIVRGKGTISPADPTINLVEKGLYKYSRNPMYLGIMLILLGEVLLFSSTYLLIYLLLVFIGFNIFIIKIEEPRLRKDFKDEYDDYCKKVSRWI